MKKATRYHSQTFRSIELLIVVFIEKQDEIFSRLALFDDTTTEKESIMSHDFRVKDRVPPLTLFMVLIVTIFKYVFYLYLTVKTAEKFYMQFSVLIFYSYLS